MKSIDICSLTILTSKVNKGHWRSQTKRHKPTRECAPTVKNGVQDVVTSCGNHVAEYRGLAWDASLQLYRRE